MCARRNTFAKIAFKNEELYDLKSFIGNGIFYFMNFNCRHGNILSRSTNCQEFCNQWHLLVDCIKNSRNAHNMPAIVLI